MRSSGKGVREPSVSLEELVDYLDQYLDSQSFQDFAPNGLQVDGNPQVRRLITAVSACKELSTIAVEREADALLVHHGLFWDNLPRSLTGIQYQRVAQLIHSSISLLAYHLPLDAHGEVGNNIIAARGLLLQELEPFGDASGSALGFRGRYPDPISAAELARRCAALFGQEPMLLGNTDSASLGTVAIVSGGAQSFLHEAIAHGVDAFITGEASEWVTNLSREANICYVVAGHHATERLGVRALGDHLAARFGIQVQFVDVPNPV